MRGFSLSKARGLWYRRGRRSRTVDSGTLFNFGPPSVGRSVSNWWDGSTRERYWCEVTDRSDVGSDLKAPQFNEAGQRYWSYSLIEEVVPGDVVFHYSTRKKCFAGASVAGGPMEHRPITWTPHGTAGRTKESIRSERPGFWRPLYDYRDATPELPLKSIEEATETTWLKGWVEAHRDAEPLRLPFQFRTDGLRAGQGYLFKMPADFVNRWMPLRTLADALDSRAEQLAMLAPAELSASSTPEFGFKPKSDADYTAFIAAAVQHRTRAHEKLVRVAGEWLLANGFVISNAHPKDLEILSPVSVIFEAKIVRHRDALFAVREAVGQLHEYRYFVGPRNAQLAVLLDEAPSETLVRYLEEHLQVAVLWLRDSGLLGGALARRLILASVGETSV